MSGLAPAIVASDIKLNDDGSVEILGYNGIVARGPVYFSPPAPVASSPSISVDAAIGGLSEHLGTVDLTALTGSTSSIGDSGSTGPHRDEAAFDDLRDINLNDFVELSAYLELLRRAILNVDARLRFHAM